MAGKALEYRLAAASDDDATKAAACCYSARTANTAPATPADRTLLRSASALEPSLEPRRLHLG